jgi:hypothetical protein
LEDSVDGRGLRVRVVREERREGEERSVWNVAEPGQER